MSDFLRPDGGWGWVVALAMFWTNMIVDGVKYSFGVMFVKLLDAFQRSKSETSLLVSIQVGVFLLSGPFVAALVNRFGCRMIAFIGTILSFVGFFSSAFVSSLYIMYISFGLIGGLGFGMLAMPGYVTLARFFDKKLAFASGIAAMGSGVGTLVFNPLSKILIDSYAWRGMLVIESGFVLNGIVCALILKNPFKSPEKTAIAEDEVEEGEKLLKLPSNMTAVKSGAQKTDEILGSDASTKDIEEVKTDDMDTHSWENDLSNDSKYVNVQTRVSADNSIVEDKATQGLHVKDYMLIETGHVEASTDSEYNQLSTYLNPDDSDSREPGRNSTQENIISETNQHKQRRWFTLTPLKNPGFLLFLSSNVLIELALYVPFTYLPDMMGYRGFQTQDAVWMLFIIGLVSTVSRLAIGFIADLRFVNRVRLCNSLIICNGVFVILCPFCFNYASFVAFSILFGFSAGCSSSLRYVLIPDLFGVEMIADFYGLTMFFSGIAAFLGLPKAGALFDASKAYILPFIVAGSELVLSGALLFIIPLVNKSFRR